MGNEPWVFKPANVIDHCTKPPIYTSTIPCWKDCLWRCGPVNYEKESLDPQVPED